MRVDYAKFAKARLHRHTPKIFTPRISAYTSRFGGEWYGGIHGRYHFEDRSVPPQNVVMAFLQIPDLSKLPKKVWENLETLNTIRAIIQKESVKVFEKHFYPLIEDEMLEEGERERAEPSEEVLEGNWSENSVENILQMLQRNSTNTQELEREIQTLNERILKTQTLSQEEKDEASTDESSWQEYTADVNTQRVLERIFERLQEKVFRRMEVKTEETAPETKKTESRVTRILQQYVKELQERINTHEKLKYNPTLFNSLISSAYEDVSGDVLNTQMINRGDLHTSFYNNVESAGTTDQMADSLKGEYSNVSAQSVMYATETNLSVPVESEIKEIMVQITDAVEQDAPVDVLGQLFRESLQKVKILVPSMLSASERNAEEKSGLSPLVQFRNFVNARSGNQILNTILTDTFLTFSPFLESSALPSHMSSIHHIPGLRYLESKEHKSFREQLESSVSQLIRRFSSKESTSGESELIRQEVENEFERLFQARFQQTASYKMQTHTEKLFKQLTTSPLLKEKIEALNTQTLSAFYPALYKELSELLSAQSYIESSGASMMSKSSSASTALSSSTQREFLSKSEKEIHKALERFFYHVEKSGSSMTSSTSTEWQVQLQQVFEDLSSTEQTQKTYAPLLQGDSFIQNLLQRFSDTTNSGVMHLPLLEKVLWRNQNSMVQAMQMISSVERRGGFQPVAKLSMLGSKKTIQSLNSRIEEHLKQVMHTYSGDKTVNSEQLEKKVEEELHHVLARWERETFQKEQKKEVEKQHFHTVLSETFNQMKSSDKSVLLPLLQAYGIREEGVKTRSPFLVSAMQKSYISSKNQKMFLAREKHLFRENLNRVFEHFERSADRFQMQSEIKTLLHQEVLHLNDKTQYITGSSERMLSKWMQKLLITKQKGVQGVRGGKSPKTVTLDHSGGSVFQSQHIERLTKAVLSQRVKEEGKKFFHSEVLKTAPTLLHTAMIERVFNQGTEHSLLTKLESKISENVYSDGRVKTTTLESHSPLQRQQEILKNRIDQTIESEMFSERLDRRLEQKLERIEKQVKMTALSPKKPDTHAERLKRDESSGVEQNSHVSRHVTEQSHHVQTGITRESVMQQFKIKSGEQREEVIDGTHELQKRDDEGEKHVLDAKTLEEIIHYVSIRSKDAAVEEILRDTRLSRLRHGSVYPV